MSSELRILMLEDSAIDAMLIETDLHAGGIVFVSQRVETEEHFRAALRDFHPDLILSDNRLPGFDGLSGLAIAQASCPQVPLIFVSGTIGEEKAVEMLRCGAVDYVLKDSRSRLVPAVQRALRDVHERQERLLAEHNLREREQTLSLALEGAGMGTWDWNILTDEVTRSERSLELLGISAEAPTTSSHLFHTVHPEDHARVESEVRLALVDPGHRFESEFRVLLPDGSERWLISKGRAFMDETSGQAVRMVGITMDITERKTAARRLAAALETAQAANRAKDHFLATLSHELRTPLSPVLLIAGAMEASPELPLEVRESFAMIRRNVALEARLIDDLLDVARLSRGKVQLQLSSLDAQALLERSLELVRADIEAKEIILVRALAASHHHVLGDPVRLLQVFCNVLNNAIRYTPPKGRITLHSHNLSPGFVRLAIADSGQGISASDMPRIFQAFAQGTPGNSRHIGGLGLGLSISHILVEQHHGRIWAESDGAGLGATFYLELPLAAPGDALCPPPLPAPTPLTKPLRILLIEDHEPTRATLTRLLERRGHTVSGADTLARARQHAALASFDLVISDLGLPDGSGHDLMLDLRRDYALSGIALSGYGMDEDVRRSFEVGFAVHLTKPVDLPALEAAIAKIIATAQSGMPSRE